MIEFIERGVSLGDVDLPLLGMWDEELEAAASARSVPRAVLLRFIVHDWLQQQRRSRDPTLHPGAPLPEEEHLRVRLLARLADRRAARREVTVADLADRLALTIEATQSLLTDLIAAGLVTATLEPTSAGARYLRGYHGVAGGA